MIEAKTGRMLSCYCLDLPVAYLLDTLLASQLLVYSSPFWVRDRNSSPALLMALSDQKKRTTSARRGAKTF